MRKKILLLTLVHPDFLPPVYAIAQSLRDLDYEIHILTFDSYKPSYLDIGSNITVESVGQHHNIGTLARLKLRRKFSHRASQIINEQPLAIITFCTFSFLCGLKIKKNHPLLYIALEVADSSFLKAFKSFSNFRSFQALAKAHKADLLATPSIQRSAWLAGRCSLDFMPFTIHNTAYLQAVDNKNTFETFKTIVPEIFFKKKIVLYTGTINAHLCIMELIQAFDIVNDSGAVLIITGIKNNTYCNQLTDYVKKIQSANNILLLPIVTREEMLALQTNANIGICLAKEYNDNIESKMMAPNKVGEYLAKELYLIGIKNEYLLPLEMTGIATLSKSVDPFDISVALKNGLQTIEQINYKDKIRLFVSHYFCMQQQIKPITKFLSTLSNQ